MIFGFLDPDGEAFELSGNRIRPLHLAQREIRHPTGLPLDVAENVEKELELRFSVTSPWRGLGMRVEVPTGPGTLHITDRRILLVGKVLGDGGAAHLPIPVEFDGQLELLRPFVMMWRSSVKGHDPRENGVGLLVLEDRRKYVAWILPGGDWAGLGLDEIIGESGLSLRGLDRDHPVPPQDEEVRRTMQVSLGAIVGGFVLGTGFLVSELSVIWVVFAALFYGVAIWGLYLLWGLWRRLKESRPLDLMDGMNYRVDVTIDEPIVTTVLCGRCRKETVEDGPRPMRFTCPGCDTELWDRSPRRPANELEALIMEPSDRDLVP